MALFNAVLAFALTLAALATVVSIIMEIAARFLGMKAKRQVQFVKKVVEDTVGRLDSYRSELDASGRDEEAASWKIVCNILENPLSKRKMAASEGGQRYLAFLDSAIYTDVSLEHFLRKLIDVDFVHRALHGSGIDIDATLKKISDKYDEYVSAIGVSFKARSRLWSLIVAVAVAYAMNVDGLKLFQSYLKSPEVADKVIRELKPAEQSTATGAAALSMPAVIRVASAAGANQQPANNEKAQETELEGKLQELDQQLALLGSLNLPIGISYFPYCNFETDPAKLKALEDPRCSKKLSWTEGRSNNVAMAVGGYGPWFLKVLVTGLLIGLGAPFWYDVARRLGPIRTFFKGTGSAEQQYRGSDAKKGTNDRDKLIAQIAADSRQSAAASVP